MQLTDVEFRRIFALNPRKTLKLPICSMDFYRDIINSDNGDPYPIIACTGDAEERFENGKYYYNGDGFTARLLGRLIPYACYELEAEALSGECGFLFKNGYLTFAVTVARIDGKTFICSNGEKKEIPCEKSISMSVQHRKADFDIYIKKDGVWDFVCTFTDNSFAHSDSESFFRNTVVCVYCSGSVILDKAESYMDCGLAQADMRPVRYEDGTVMTENGKVYLTETVRMHEECFQGVFAWTPGTCDFTLTGVLFFDAGDGVWGNEVASSILFERKTQKWLMWVCDFSHGHVLAHASFDGDPRFGINVIDVALMRPMTENGTEAAFAGRTGDEDPDFFFDANTNKWYMAICRHCDENHSYRYMFFASDKPFENYGYVACGLECDGAETGGSFVKYDGKVYFVCGNDFSEKSVYRVYCVPSFEYLGTLKADFPDGGFRGWGTVMELNAASRKKLYWLTFDRCNASDYRWSYGNIYCFEG